MAFVSASTSFPLYLIYRSEEDFKIFMDTIKDLLKKNKFADLHQYVNRNGTPFRGNLEDEGTLELLLESYLNTSEIDDENFTRAIELARLMEENLYSPTWAKIAKAMLYYSRGEMEMTHTLVAQMVQRDQNPDFSLRTRSELINLRNDYIEAENPLLESRIRAILKMYNEITVSMPAPLESDTSEMSQWSRV